MELMTFDFKNLLFSLIFFFSTCQTSGPVSLAEPETSPVKLTIPKDDESKENYDNITAKLTLILLSNNRVYAYEGKDIGNGNFYSTNATRNVIKKSRANFPSKDFIILIKPSIQASYNSTVDMLDEMTLNNIQRYAVVELNKIEKQKFEKHAITPE